MWFLLRLLTAFALFPVLDIIRFPLCSKSVLVFLGGCEFVSAYVTELGLIRRCFRAGDMRLWITALAAQRADRPVFRIVCLPVIPIVMGSVRHITADIAVGIAGTIKAVRFKVLLLFAAFAGKPMSILVPGQVLRKFMDMIQPRGQCAAAGQTKLCLFFRCGRSGGMND